MEVKLISRMSVLILVLITTLGANSDNKNPRLLQAHGGPYLTPIRINWTPLISFPSNNLIRPPNYRPVYYGTVNTPNVVILRPIQRPVLNVPISPPVKFIVFNGEGNNFHLGQLDAKVQPSTIEPTPPVTSPTEVGFKEDILLNDIKNQQIVSSETTTNKPIGNMTEDGTSQIDIRSGFH